ncbi:DNA-binding protein, excisionase family [Desulfitobacterium dichloroeliminans LMG P-21439]|uniref:DNA-binding protein, excisionase family n=1 Tax=Desulfitobacterium dichloroeliminans (strain LMG P-21439 / DCA1) TaxID=871963 RepID=L0F5B4_DESDL|nr:DNA-binding protein, excisionase family [Desulfitobacterium dichloroeliminans LMG P-21439]
MRIYQSEVVVLPETIHNGRWISLQEVCDYLGVKRHTVMRWIEQRGMPASKVGKLWRFKAADIDEWVKRGGASDEQEGVNEQA